MVLDEMMQKRCVEPRKRMVGGCGPRWAIHRFAIKGGITLGQAMAHSLFNGLGRTPSMLDRLALETAMAHPASPLVKPKRR